MAQQTVLRQIDFTKIGNKLGVEDYKVRSITFVILKTNTAAKKFFAFQFGQALALINGKDIYTKKEIADLYPHLHPFIYRQQDVIFLETSLAALNGSKDEFIRQIEDVEIHKKGNLYLFDLKAEKLQAILHEGVEWNHYHHQSRGMLVDVKTGQLVCYPLNQPFALGLDHKYLLFSQFPPYPSMFSFFVLFSLFPMFLLSMFSPLCPCFLCVLICFSLSMFFLSRCFLFYFLPFPIFSLILCSLPSFVPC